MKKSILLTVATLALTVGLVRPAQAALFVSISDGVATVTCTFGGACAAGFTQNNANSISFIGTVGQYTINTSTSSSNNPGAPGNASLSVTTNQVTRTTVGTNSLFLWASQTGFLLPALNGGQLGNTGSASVSHDAATIIPGDSFSVQTWIDTTNTAHNNVGNVGVAGAGVTNNGPCTLTAPGLSQSESNNCNSGSVAFANSIPFSLTQKDTLFINSAAANLAESLNTTGTSSVSATTVPEPASLLFFGTGLIGLASNVRRRMRRK